MGDPTHKTVDADIHISESEGMWELLDREMHHRRPVLMSVPDDTVYGARNAFWLIDGNIFPKPSGKGGRGGRAVSRDLEAHRHNRMA